jgi:hypothetical protein
MMRDIENKEIYANKAKELEDQLGFTISEDDVVIA